ncbi:Hypothetical protein, putative, partial [Bodo saltans]
VHQGYSIEKLAILGFLDQKEAAGWGGGTSHRGPSASSSSGHVASQNNKSKQQPASNSNTLDHEFERVPTGDPAVDMILSVLPHFTPTLAANALGYYNGDVELLINDALSGNLPPHLEAELPLHGDDDSSAHGPSAATYATIPEDEEEDHYHTASSYHVPSVDTVPQGDMERFVSSHYIDETDEAAYDDDDGGNMLTTVDGHALSETLYLDDGFREHTFEFLYEDERDDANDGEAHVWGAVGALDDSSEDDEMRDLAPLNNHAVPAGSAGSTAPFAHHDGRDGRGGRGSKFGGSRQQPATSGERGRGRGRGSGRGAGGAAAAAPSGDEGRPASYKKVKERKAGGGGSKSALQRSIKRSGFE